MQDLPGGCSAFAAALAFFQGHQFPPDFSAIRIWLFALQILQQEAQSIAAANAPCAPVAGIQIPQHGAGSIHTSAHLFQVDEANLAGIRLGKDMLWIERTVYQGKAV